MIQTVEVGTVVVTRGVREPKEEDKWDVKVVRIDSICPLHS